MAAMPELGVSQLVSVDLARRRTPWAMDTV
jgi:hypothetical protein